MWKASEAYDRLQAKAYQKIAAAAHDSAVDCRDNPHRNGRTPWELEKMYQKQAAEASRRARRHMGLES